MQQQQQQQQQKGIWLPLIASVGVGAATFYTMTRNGKGMGQTLQQIVPFVAGLKSNQSSLNSNQQQEPSTQNSQTLQ